MFKGKLWPYQEEAAERMVDRGQMLLGMVMGAGKTPTALGAVEELRAEGEVDRCLVVVPASLKYQWKREIEKFTDASLIVIDGDKGKRAEQWRTSFRHTYVIVNPETLINDVKLIGTFQCIVVDEATIIKNRSAKRTRLLKKIGKTIPYRFALTGQPIENRPEELFSIMEFVDRDVLGTFEVFDRTFIVRDHWGKPIRYRNLDKMNKVMQECMIRKTREDIADQLPDIIHQTIPVPFDAKGAALYRVIAKDLLNQIATAIKHGNGGFNLWAHYNNPEGKEAQGQIMSRLTVLRMLCDNPALVSVSANNYDDPDTKAGSEYAATLAAAGKLTGLTAAPKLDAVLEYIQDVLDEDPKNKVVLFSFFKDNLRLIQKATSGITDSVLFMGGMSAEDRDKAKQKFQTDPNCRLFLSSDAGGYGVDLPQANYCVESGTMILRGDLQWVPASTLLPGDKIVGVEEHRRGKGMPRLFEMGEVTSNLLVKRECLNVAFSNGDSLIVTPDHKMLVKTGKGWFWKEAQELVPGWQVSKAFDMWTQQDTFDGGWMAGMLDGEGCVSRIGNGIALTMSQNQGPVLDRFLQVASDHGFDFRDSGRDTTCKQFVLRGGKSEVARFLGTFPSVRLQEKWRTLVGKCKLMAVDTPFIVSVTPVGEREVAVLNTTCRTYIAQGYVQHNCISYDLPWSSGKLEQREARIIRLSSEFPHVTIATFVMQGSIEERMYEMLQQKKSVNEAFIDGKHLDKDSGMAITLDTLTAFLRDSQV